MLIKMRGKRGQFTLEFAIVATAIAAAVLLAVPKIKQAIQNNLEHVAAESESAVEQIRF